MTIRSQTIRLGIFISTIIIAAIIIFQLIWLKKVYNYEQKSFNHSIAKAIRGLYEDVGDTIVQTYNLNELVTPYNSQTFFARINSVQIGRDSICNYLQSELEDEDIFTDCYVGLYNAQQKKYLYTIYLPSATAANNEKVLLPTSAESYDHLTLYFPHRKQYILSLMNFWIIGSLLILIVLILLAASLYYFYRQKFLNEIQKDFVNNFTHEFKTPVSVINLAAEVLANPANAAKPAKVLQYAGIVQYQGKYLQEQIERLLKHAYAEKNDLHLSKEKVDLHAIIDESLKNLEAFVTSTNAQIERSYDAVNPVVIADKGYLMIMIMNLIENALKYATHPKLQLSTWSDDNNIYVSVKDNGKGIEKKYRNKIFNKFYRIPNGEQVQSRGFGLGLAFVKKIVQAHQGKINVDSIPGIGSDFRISLPQT
jgi:two-component system phosphate regulon sensor histidine kinase PhoR